MKTFSQIREAKLILKISNPTKKLGSGFFPATIDAIKGKVIKFNWAGTGQVGIDPRWQEEIIPIIKKYNIRSFAWGGKPKGASWLKAWIKSNKNLKDAGKGSGVVLGAEDGKDISKEILAMIKAYSSKFDNPNSVNLYFIEIQ